MDFEEELKRVADAYAKQGYQVTIRPEQQSLPAFAAGFEIEILCKRAAEGVLVAVKKDRDAVAADPNVTRSWRRKNRVPGRLIGQRTSRKKKSTSRFPTRRQ